MCHESTKSDNQFFCGSCPRVCHPNCSSPINGVQWFCSRCIELGVNEQLIITQEEKKGCLLRNHWILLFLKSLRKWLPVFVIEGSKDDSSFLCDYSNSMYLTTKVRRWFDIRGGTILKVPDICLSIPGYGNDFEVLETRRKNIFGLSMRNNSMNMSVFKGNTNETDHDTYLSPQSFDAALCAAGVATSAVDTVVNSRGTNAFACIRPPGHHAGRHGFTKGCTSTGFCLLNNAAIAMVYARVKYGLMRVAIVDIDVHFGNGTAELLRGDPNAFFASVHMIYGETNEGI